MLRFVYVMTLGAGLLLVNALSAKEFNYVDIHAHAACIDTLDKDCYISPAMKKNIRYKIFMKAFMVTPEELDQHGGALVFKRLSEQVNQSKWVAKTVVLALDGIYVNGKMDFTRTNVYIPNEFVKKNTDLYENLHFAASINPNRPNALSLVKQAKKDGAVFIKWIPSIMDINPSDPSLIPFYQLLIELKLPLLTHTGKEDSFVWTNNDLADPELLTLPLNMGVTIIAAHVASTGGWGKNSDYNKLRNLFTNPKYRHNLFADISALTQINRVKKIKKIMKDPIFHGRLFYGTDWPLINVKLPYVGTKLIPYGSYPLFTSLTRDQVKQIDAEENLMDKDVLLKAFLGLKPPIIKSDLPTLRINGL